MTPPGSRWLLRFSTRSPGEELQRLVAAQKFHATLRPRIDAEVDRFMAEQERIDPPAQPIVEHGEPADPDAPANTAAALGGFLSIRAPWHRD